MSTLFIVLAIIAALLTAIFIVVSILNTKNSKSNAKEEITSILIVLALWSITFWCGFFYGVGVKHGAERTAKGKYKIGYVHDENGCPSDTVVYWH